MHWRYLSGAYLSGFNFRKKNVITPQNKKVEYIGDGVYVKIENGSLILMANHHEQPTDIIVLEPEILFKLMKYIEIY